MYEPHLWLSCFPSDFLQIGSNLDCLKSEKGYRAASSDPFHGPISETLILNLHFYIKNMFFLLVLLIPNSGDLSLF